MTLSIENPLFRQNALVELVQGLATVKEWGRAEALTHSIIDNDERAQILRKLSVMTAEASEMNRATALASQADALTAYTMKTGTAKVVQIPVSGQPGRYITGLLPVSPTVPSPVPSRSRRLRIVLLVLIVLVLILISLFIVFATIISELFQNLSGKFIIMGSVGSIIGISIIIFAISRIKSIGNS